MYIQNPNIWPCPNCGRQVPRRVPMCRCGASTPLDTREMNRTRAAASRTKALVSVAGILLFAAGAFSTWSFWAPSSAEALPVGLEAAVAVSPLDLEPIPSIHVPEMPALESAPAPAKPDEPRPVATMHLVDGVSAPSAEAADARTKGEAAFRAAMSTARRHADQVDEYWNARAAKCVANASTTGNRVWLALFEPNGFALSGLDCQDWFRSLQGYAQHVRTEVTNASEQARRAGVYPGVVRDVRREHRLEWAGW
jgi:hypothetical protein